MTSAEIIEEIGVRLARVAPRDSRVVLFGSHARGEADAGSDYDILVIEPAVADAAHESVRLTSLQLVGRPFAEADLLNAGRLVEAAVKR